MRVLEFGNGSFASLPKKVMDGIVTVGLDAFGPGMTAAEIMAHVLPSDRLFLGYDNNEIMGFATARLTKSVLDLVGSAVVKKYQGNGLYKEFVVRRVAFGLEQGSDAVTVRTQNPRIEMGLQKGLEELVNLGLISGYRQEQHIVYRLYGRKLTEEMPKSGLPDVDGKYNALNYSRGDAFSFCFYLERAQ